MELEIVSVSDPDADGGGVVDKLVAPGNEPETDVGSGLELPVGAVPDGVWTGIDEFESVKVGTGNMDREENTLPEMVQKMWVVETAPETVVELPNGGMIVAEPEGGIEISVPTSVLVEVVGDPDPVLFNAD